MRAGLEGFGEREKDPVGCDEDDGRGGRDDDEGLSDRDDSDGLAERNEGEGLSGRDGDDVLWGRDEDEGLSERAVLFSVSDFLNGRVENFGLSECSRLAGRALVGNLEERGKVDGLATSGLLAGTLLAAGFEGRSWIGGVGGLATRTPAAALFSFATSSKVRLRQSPGGMSRASGPY